MFQKTITTEICINLETIEELRDAVGLLKEENPQMIISIKISIGGSSVGKNMEISQEKREWLKKIGAGEFPVPIKFIYMIDGNDSRFNLSEEYVINTPLEELKRQYEKNKKYIESKKHNELCGASKDYR